VLRFLAGSYTHVTHVEDMNTCACGAYKKVVL